MLSYEHFLFLDTETSGVPENWQAPTTDVDKWPYIVQIAWLIYDRQGKKIKEREFYIKAEDYKIKETSRQIHGITEEMANARGVARKEALKSLYRDLRQFKPLIVGHFVTLDLHMIQAGFSRSGIKNIIRQYPSFCTMQATSDYIHFSNRHYPRLGELYERMFKRKMDNEHSASGDARAVAECFFELVRRDEVDDALVQRQMKDREKDTRARNKKGCGVPIFLLIIVILTYSLWLM